MHRGQHMTEEQKAKLSAVHIGLKASPQTRAKMSVSHKGKPSGNKGHHMTEEQRAMDSTSHMGIVSWNKGIPATEEQKAKDSAALMGNTNSRGHHCSEETKMKTSMAMMGHAPSGPKHHTPETKVKMSTAHWKGGRSVWSPKRDAKRRLLGFNPLNSWFVGCEGHHINPNDVIHLLKKLHKSIYHNQITGQGMVAMNALAGAFLTEGWT